MPMAVINQEIADTIDYVVQIQKDKKTGKHFISEITEISNIINDKDGADIKVNPIWEYEPESEEFRRKGYPEDDDIREGITGASRIGQY
jgi:Flp pilus assembly CpaF family ATPase